MTVILTFFGLFVFVISLFTAGFKSAFKRLIMFAAAGLAIDLIIIGLAIAVGFVATF